MDSNILPREVLKWLQSLNLSHPLKSTKWDVANGYLIAEICSWYFPEHVSMPMYQNETKVQTKHCNWSLIRKVLKKNNVNISDDLIEATMQCKETAAALLLQVLYEQLTNHKLEKPNEIDFTDHTYQSKLVLHCRSTALQALRNNISLAESLVDHDSIANQRKAMKILDRHSEDRVQQRLDHMERFDRQLTVGELAVRKSPPPSPVTSSSQLDYHKDITPQSEGARRQSEQ